MNKMVSEEISEHFAYCELDGEDSTVTNLTRAIAEYIAERLEADEPLLESMWGSATRTFPLPEWDELTPRAKAMYIAGAACHVASNLFCGLRSRVDDGEIEYPSPSATIATMLSVRIY